MRFLKSVELNNYLNLKHAKLKDLKDLNIIIGPNNCGKTSLLKAVDLLRRINPDSVPCSCEICLRAVNELRKHFEFTVGATCHIEPREKYLTRGKISAIFGFYKTELERELPDLSIFHRGTKDREDADHFRSEYRKRRLIMKEGSDGNLILEHVSPYIHPEIKAKMFFYILLCPDERLQTYKGKPTPEYIQSKDFGTVENKNLIDILEQVVDPKISDLRQSMNLVRDVEGQKFTTTIAEQGSGVKSIICLITDTISARETRILLVDEPELGLNPSGKHGFLKFLMEQSKDKQIFLATHDPTFVNPILWNRENVSVYLFSIIKDEFVKVNLVQSKQDPNTFAGFLPHTTSLKRVHIYVEGTDDVYIFQIFLNKYARNNFEKWYQIANNVGIYHLAGDFWKHLLYTIPKRPYTSVVVLDGDKKKVARKVIAKYTTIEKDRFKIFDSPDEMNRLISKMPTCPVYCLKRSEIEDYLKPRPSSKNEGPAIADKMKHIPPEIDQLFDAIFQLADIRNE